MALRVGELFSELKIETGGAEKSLSDHQRALQQTEQQAGRTEKAVASIGQVISGAGNQARSSTTQFSNMGRGVEQAGRQAGTTGTVFQRMGQMITGAVGRALSLGNSMRNVGQTAGQMERGVSGGSRSLRDMADASNQTEGALSRVGSMMSNVVSVATGFITAQIAMRAMSAAASALGQAISVEANASFEQLEIALGHILGDLDKANEILWDLVDVANASPFSYRELTEATRQLAAFRFEADHILPILQIVGDAVATIGGGGAEMASVVNMLGRIQMAQRATFSDLNQLATMGINVYEILAQQMGTTTSEIIEMAQAGGIVADQVIPALLAGLAEDFGGGMAAQAETYTGAMSQIIDVARTFQWTLLERPFRTVRDALVDFNRYLAQDTTQEFLSRWSDTIAEALDGMAQTVVSAIRAIPDAIDSLRDGVAGFRSFVSGVLTEGITLSGFLESLPSWFHEALDRIGEMMGIGGHNAIVAYAQGIVDGASTYVTQAINYVADLIASYLVGQSPPPEGPLSEIDKAGQNLMETYTEGMVEGAAGAEDAAGRVTDALDLVDEQAQLDAGRAGLEAATGNLEEMEAASASVESKIKDIQREIAQIDLELLEIDRTTADINAKYDEQLEPLNEQLRLLEKQRDLSAEKLRLEHDLQRAQVDAAMLAAMGDPERRAEIAGEMALVDIQQDRLDNEQKIADIKAQLEGGGEELTAAERERLELRERDLELQRKETQAKLKDGKDLSKLEKERLQLKLAQIDADLRANRAKQDAEPEELTEAERQRLELQLRELELRGELLAMIDAEATAQATADGELLDARQREKELVDEIADIQNEIAKIPILEEIKAIEDARREELKPLELQRDLLVEQKEDLNYLRQHWQFLAGDVGAALEPLREAARLQEQIAKDAERAAKAAGGGAGRAAAGAGTGGDPDAPGFVMPDLPTWSEMFPEQDALEIPVEIVGADGDNLTLDMLGHEPKPLGERIGAMIADGMIGRIGELVRQNMGRVIGASVGAAIGGGLLGVLSRGVLTPVGTAIGGLLGGLIGDGVQERLTENPIDFGGFVERIQATFDEHVRPVFDRFHEWLVGGQENVQSFSETVSDFFNNWIAPALQRISDDLLPVFQEAWARIEPTIEPAIRNVARLFEWISGQIDIHSETIRAIVDGVWRGIAWLITFYTERWSEIISGVLAVIGGDWETVWKSVRDFASGIWTSIGTIVSLGIKGVQKFVEDAIPVIWAKLKEWGGAFWQWVEPQIEPMLEELGKLLYRLGEWVITDALPALAEKLWEWGVAFVEWVGPMAYALLEELGSLQARLVRWIVTEALPAYLEKLAEWGLAFVSWVAPQIPVLLTKLGELLIALGAWVVNTAAPAIVSSLSAWGVAFLNWIATDVSPFLWSKLQAVADAILAWITDDALPAIKTNLLTWAAAFLNFIVNDVIPFLPGKLAALLTVIGEWVRDNVTTVKSQMMGIGSAVVQGMWEGIKAAGSWIKDKLTGWIDEYIPDTFMKVLEIFSPSRVMAGIGRQTVEGLMAGMEQMSPALAGRSRHLGQLVADNAAAMTVAVPRVSSQMALPASAGGNHNSFFGERDRAARAGATTVVVPINVGGREAERWVIDVVNGHARRAY